MKKFIRMLTTYLSDESVVYPEYRGKPYFDIEYEENGERHVGFGTYNPEVLSCYLRDYFIDSRPKTEENLKEAYELGCIDGRKKFAEWFAKQLKVDEVVFEDTVRRWIEDYLDDVRD